MKPKEAILYLSQSQLDFIAQVCSIPSKDPHNPTTFDTYVTPFDDGVEAEVKVCNGDYPYCEVVLFKDGSEIGHSDAYDNLNYSIELQGYRVNFIPTMKGLRGYYQLNEEEKKIACKDCLDQLLGYIYEGCDDFDDPKLNHKIDIARKRAHAMQTPWFIPEYVIETCRQELEKIAFKNAVQTLYVDDTISINTLSTR